ncbi:MAG: phage baseplate assembly protein [Pseudomonadota bacterium]
MSDVQLKIGNQVYGGWTQVKVRRSLDLFASTFDLAYTDRWPGQNGARPIALGAAAELYIDGQKLITGYVDKAPVRYSARERSLGVSGRSKVADLVDCTFNADKLNGVQRNDQTLLQLADYLAKPFRVKAKSSVAGLKVIEQPVINSIQTAFDFLEKLSRKEAVMLLDDPDGNLVIARASSRRAPTALVLGQNILECDGEESHRDRFSIYNIFGQYPDPDSQHAPEWKAHVSGRAEDAGMRYRPTTIDAETALDYADAERRAIWQRNLNYGRSRQYTYIVNGWRHKDGLWEPNTLVLVFDPWAGIVGKDDQGEWLMIGTVEYLLDESGERSRLTVMPKEAYDLIPIEDDAP